MEVGWGTPHEHPLTQVMVEELRKMSFAPSSMAPKVDAASRFVEQTGGLAAIGALSVRAGAESYGARGGRAPDGALRGLV